VLRLEAEVGTGGEAVGEEVALSEHKSRPQRPGQRVLFDRQQPRINVRVDLIAGPYHVADVDERISPLMLNREVTWKPSVTPNSGPTQNSLRECPPMFVRWANQPICRLATKIFLYVLVSVLGAWHAGGHIRKGRINLQLPPLAFPAMQLCHAVRSIR
jgi:hypothetical protein